jgi:hypothetical protein
MSDLLSTIAYLDLVTVQTENGPVTGRATSFCVTTGSWTIRVEGSKVAFATAKADNVIAVDKTQPIEPPAPRRDAYFDLQRDPIQHFGAYY